MEVVCNNPGVHLIRPIEPGSPNNALQRATDGDRLGYNAEPLMAESTWRR